MHLSSQENLHAELVLTEFDTYFMKGLYRNHIAVAIEAVGALRPQVSVKACASDQKGINVFYCL